MIHGIDSKSMIEIASKNKKEYRQGDILKINLEKN